MKKSSFLLGTSLFVILFISSFAFADSEQRDGDKAAQCFSQYEQLANAAMQADEEVAAELREQAQQQFRCVRRLEAKPSIAQAKKSTKEIQQKIKFLKRKIKKLTKKAERAMKTNITLGLNIWSRIADLELKVNRLKERLYCPESKTTIQFTLENNSSYKTYFYLGNNQGSGALVGEVPSGKIGKAKVTLENLKQKYIGQYETSGLMYLLAIINGQEVWIKKNFSVAKRPKKKPCKKTIKWEYFTKNFPVPAVKYAVFGVNAGPNLYVGTAASLESRVPCSFKNGGTNCTDPVTYAPLSGTYNSYIDAQKALCNGITKKVWWNMAARCQKRYMFGGKYYWGCESSVQDAISKYCPQWKL